jgi:DNA-binding Lrp family transcriptional regulator
MDMPEVLEVHHVSGEFDFLLKILVQDMHTYEALLREKILRIKGVGQIRSSFVLASPKSTTAVPI